MVDMGEISYETMKQRQLMSLDAKIAFTWSRIRAWYLHYQGDVYVSYSGGKDSTVLRDIVKGIFPDVPAVFCDTGLEYPEVRELALRNADVVLKPEMTFKAVLERYGYPVVGKKQARMVRALRNEHDGNRTVCNLYRTGYTSDGRYSPSFKLAKRWMPLVDAPFDVSEQCCDVMKKAPLAKYERETGRKPIIGVMAEESQTRRAAYLKNGCNAFDKAHPSSSPMAIWTEQDVLRYLKQSGIEYASCYGEIVEGEDGMLHTTREKRTGCMFCMFGVHLEGEPNRFQRMQRDYPKQYDYCMGKLGIGKVLDYIGVPKEYEPNLLDLIDNEKPEKTEGEE